MKNIFKKFVLCALLVGVGAGAWSCDPKENENTPATLAKPTEAKATDVTATTATLTWDAVEGADRYEVRVGDDASIKNTADNSYDLTSLAPETEYTWQVRALKGNEVSDWAQGEAFTTEKGGTVAPDPIEPTNLTVSNITTTSATLSWVAPSEAPVGYDVRLNGGTISDAGNATSYPVSGLTPGTNYTWEVRARFDDTQSDWVSNAFTTLPDDGGNDGEMSVSVNFGDGEEVWEAEYGAAIDWEDGEVSLELYKYAEEGQDLPSIDAIINISGETIFPDASEVSEYVYFDYWSEAYDSRETDDGVYIVGDWGVVSGTTNITSYENQLISGTATLTMRDSYAFYMLGDTNPERKSLVITFENVPVYFYEEEATRTRLETKMDRAAIRQKIRK